MIEYEHVMRRKWCPAIRLRNTFSKALPYNRSIFPSWFQIKNSIFQTLFPRLHWWFRGKHGACYGRDCAMWRWHSRTQGTGYCGLAGKPDMID